MNCNERKNAIPSVGDGVIDLSFFVESNAGDEARGGLLVDFGTIFSRPVPGDAVQFDLAVMPHRLTEWGILQNGDDLVRHLIHIPEVNFEGVGQDLGHA